MKNKSTAELDKIIPEQIKTGNICPIEPEGKGAGYINKKDILDVAKQLGIDSTSINPEAYTNKNGNIFVSWKGFHLLPEPIQTHFKNVAVKKGYDLGIKTGIQKDGRYIIVFDCDGKEATEYKNFVTSVYGDAFIRKTPSGGFHLFYKSLMTGILNNNQHIDLRYYLTRGDEPFRLEIKQGSFIKEIGANRTTISDLPITELNLDIDFIQKIKDNFKDVKQIKPFIDDNKSSISWREISPNNKSKLEDNKLIEAMSRLYLPRYISKELDEKRDSIIIPATMGFLKQRNISKTQREQVLQWINDVAEHKKKGTPDTRSYDFNKIPKREAGGGVLKEYGFDDFVSEINRLSPKSKFEVRLPREPTKTAQKTAVYPNPHGEYPLSPMMEVITLTDEGEEVVSYNPIVNGLEIIESHVYFPLYEELGITTYDVKLKMRGKPIKYDKITGDDLKTKLVENHAAYFNYQHSKSGSTIIEIIHTLAIAREDIGWTAGGKGIYYDFTKDKIVAEDISRPKIEHVKHALLEVNQLLEAMYPETRDEMTGIMLWFLSGAFNLVRKQLNFDKRQSCFINAGDINRGKSEAPELGSRLWYPYHEMLLTERNSTGFSTRARRREAMGITTVPIRVEEFDNDAYTLKEFQADLRDEYNMVYNVIQQQNGDIRRTMMKSLPYISTNEKMMFQNEAFAKRAIIYETNGSIPKEAMEKYRNVKSTISFENWESIGALATCLVIDGEIDLNQPWNEFAMELIEKIYKKAGLHIHESWNIPMVFTEEHSMKIIEKNTEETLLNIMKRAILNKLGRGYMEDRIESDIYLIAKELKTKWLYLLNDGKENKIVIKSYAFENAQEDHGMTSIPRGSVKKVLLEHGGEYRASNIKVLGGSRSSGIIMTIEHLSEVLFGKPEFIDTFITGDDDEMMG